MAFEAPSGFRAIAFWNTGEVTVLDDAGADSLLGNPANMTPRAHERLVHEPRITLLFRETNVRRGTIREVYRFDRGVQEPAPPPRLTSSFKSGRRREGWRGRNFIRSPFPLRPAMLALRAESRSGYRVSREGKLVNWNDAIRHVTTLEPRGRDGWGYMYFVAPYDAGRCDITARVFDGTNVWDKTNFSVDVVPVQVETSTS